MTMDWNNLWRRRQAWVRNAGLISVGLMGIHYGAIQPAQSFRGIAQSRQTGLAAIEDQRHEHWFQPSVEEGTDEGIGGGVPGGVMLQKGVTEGRGDGDVDHKIVRTGSLVLVVEKPGETAKSIQRLAETAGGFLLNWDTDGGQEATHAFLRVRVPVANYESARASILKLAQRVENEQMQAEDVTRQYVDQEARLRNLHAQEIQYLTILKLAHTVKDTLDVSERLNQVRGEVEKQQSEFNTLSRQVQLVAISVSIRKETEAQLFGLSWRPVYETKFAARRGVEGLIEYSTSVMSFLFYLPAVALWMATILLGLIVSWRVLLWAWKVLLVPRAKAA
jgi:hypothetical protein